MGKPKEKVNDSVGIPFVVTYHPCLANLPSIVRKHYYLLQSNEEVKRLFSSKQFVSFRAARSLKNYLVRAKISPLERITGSGICHKKSCGVCHNICESNQFASSVDNRVNKINHQLNCDSKLLVYLLTYKRCGIVCWADHRSVLVFVEQL